MSELPKRHDGMRLDPNAGILDIPSPGQEAQLRRYKAPRAVHPSPDETDNPALDFEPEHVPIPKKDQVFPPIVTIDGRLDTDIDHLMDDEDDAALVPARNYPRPHVFSVIEGSIDDDIDAMANHDGTMEHTLVDSPKQFHKNLLLDVNTKHGRKKGSGRAAIEHSPIRGLPSPGTSRSLMPTDRSHNKQKMDFSDEEEEEYMSSMHAPPPSPSSSHALNSKKHNSGDSRQNIKPKSKNKSEQGSISPPGSQKTVSYSAKSLSKSKKKKRTTCSEREYSREFSRERKSAMEDIDLPVTGEIQVRQCNFTSNFKHVESCSSCNTNTRIDELNGPIDALKKCGEFDIIEEENRLARKRVYMSRSDNMSQTVSGDSPVVAKNKTCNKICLDSPIVSDNNIHKTLNPQIWMDSDDSVGFRPPRHLLLQNVGSKNVPQSNLSKDMKRSTPPTVSYDFYRQENIDNSQRICREILKEDFMEESPSPIREYKKQDKTESCTTKSSSDITLDTPSARMVASLTDTSCISQCLKDCYINEKSKRGVENREIIDKLSSTASLEKYLELVSKEPKSSNIRDSLNAAIKVAEQSMSAAAKVAQALSLVIEATKASKSLANSSSSSDTDMISLQKNQSTLAELYRTGKNATSVENREGKEKLYLLKENQLLSYIECFRRFQKDQDRILNRKDINNHDKDSSKQKSTPQNIQLQEEVSVCTAIRPKAHMDFTSNHKRDPCIRRKHEGGDTQKINQPICTNKPIIRKYIDSVSKTSPERIQNRNPTCNRPLFLSPKRTPETRGIGLQKRRSVRYVICSKNSEKEKLSQEKPIAQKPSNEKNQEKPITPKTLNKRYLPFTHNRKISSIDKATICDGITSTDKSTTFQCHCSTQTFPIFSSSQTTITYSDHKCSGQMTQSPTKNVPQSEISPISVSPRNTSPPFTTTNCPDSSGDFSTVNKCGKNEDLNIDSIQEDCTFRGACPSPPPSIEKSPKIYSSPLSKYFSRLFKKSAEEIIVKDTRGVSIVGSCVDPVGQISPTTKGNDRMSELLEKYQCSPLEGDDILSQDEEIKDKFMKNDNPQKKDGHKKVKKRDQNAGDISHNHSTCASPTRQYRVNTSCVSYGSSFKFDRQASPSVKRSLKKGKQNIPQRKSSKINIGLKSPHKAHSNESKARSRRSSNGQFHRGSLSTQLENWMTNHMNCNKESREKYRHVATLATRPGSRREF